VLRGKDAGAHELNHPTAEALCATPGLCLQLYG
jgi:hypothetical protein